MGEYDDFVIRISRNSCGGNIYYEDGKYILRWHNHMGRAWEQEFDTLALALTRLTNLDFVKEPVNL